MSFGALVVCRSQDFNHLIFYQLQHGEILVLRVVHGARDLESLF